MLGPTICFGIALTMRDELTLLKPKRAVTLKAPPPFDVAFRGRLPVACQQQPDSDAAKVDGIVSGEVYV